jgi:hypothetical protein
MKKRLHVLFSQSYLHLELNTEIADVCVCVILSNIIFSQHCFLIVEDTSQNFVLYPFPNSSHARPEILGSMRCGSFMSVSIVHCNHCCPQLHYRGPYHAKDGNDPKHSL